MVSSTCRNGEAKDTYSQLMELSRFPQVKEKDNPYFLDFESYESEGRVLKQAGICEIQCSIQDIKNRLPLSGPSASLISSCVQFWSKPCHVGQVNFISLHQKKTFYMNEQYMIRNMDLGLL